MTDIIKINNQNSQFPVDARELHRKLNTKSKFIDWITNRINQYGFKQGFDYQSLSKNLEKPQGGRPSIEYLISLDMAKELAMLENNETGRKIRLYFIEVERIHREGPFGSLGRRNIDGILYYDYKEVLGMLALSTRSGQFHHRIRRYRTEFVQINNRWFVSAHFARLMWQHSEVNRLRQLTYFKAIETTIKQQAALNAAR